MRIAIGRMIFFFKLKNKVGKIREGKIKKCGLGLKNLKG
jgi:hypothetical protein